MYFSSYLSTCYYWPGCWNISYLKYFCWYKVCLNCLSQMFVIQIMIILKPIKRNIYVHVPRKLYYRKYNSFIINDENDWKKWGKYNFPKTVMFLKVSYFPVNCCGVINFHKIRGFLDILQLAHLSLFTTMMKFSQKNSLLLFLHHLYNS